MAGTAPCEEKKLIPGFTTTREEKNVLGTEGREWFGVYMEVLRNPDDAFLRRQLRALCGDHRIREGNAGHGGLGRIGDGRYMRRRRIAVIGREDGVASEPRGAACQRGKTGDLACFYLISLALPRHGGCCGVESGCMDAALSSTTKESLPKPTASLSDGLSLRCYIIRIYNVAYFT